MLNVKIILDECVPGRIAKDIPHDVSTVHQLKLAGRLEFLCLVYDALHENLLRVCRFLIFHLYLNLEY